MLRSTTQRETSKKNAQQSTGPKTAEGMEIASQNAMRHGLRAREILMHDDIGDDVDEYIEAMKNFWVPVGIYEEQLVARITAISWRLRRLSLVETETVNDSYEELSEEGMQADLGKAFRRTESLSLYMRYESHLDRALRRNVKMLEEAQRERRNYQSPIIAVADAIQTATHKAIAEKRRQLVSESEELDRAREVQRHLDRYYEYRGYDVPRMPPRQPAESPAVPSSPTLTVTSQQEVKLPNEAEGNLSCKNIAQKRSRFEQKNGSVTRNVGVAG